LNYRNLQVSWEDSLTSIEKEKQIRKLQAEYQLEKKQRELASERQQRVIFAGCALFFAICAFFLFRSNKEKERLNRLLQIQNKRRHEAHPGE
jgi:hypothetical protein